MKTYFAFLVAFVALILIFGSPFPQESIARGHRWESRVPVLPMTFAHEDHVAQNCVLCHHNYVDDTGGDPCMYCHVTDETVFPLFEQQFHVLCRGCHEDKRAARAAGGPTRVCVDCHVEEDMP